MIELAIRRLLYVPAMMHSLYLYQAELEQERADRGQRESTLEEFLDFLKGGEV